MTEKKSDKYLHRVEIQWLSEHQDVLRPEFDDDEEGVDVNGVDIDAILYEMSEGEYCGVVSYKGCETISHESAVAKLVEFGNDGKFFDGVQAEDFVESLVSVLEDFTNSLTSKSSVDWAENNKQAAESEGIRFAAEDPCPMIVERPSFGMMLRAKRTRWFDIGSISKKRFFVRFSFTSDSRIKVELCPYSLLELPSKPDKTQYVVFDDNHDAFRSFLASPYLSRIEAVGRYKCVWLDEDGNLLAE